jgi:hypothetical protein
MGSALNLLIAFSALTAAILWFWSASVTLPRLKSYWDSAPPDDPFYVAVKRSAKLNAWAAGFSGLSAFLVFVKMALSI